MESIWLDFCWGVGGGGRQGGVYCFHVCPYVVFWFLQGLSNNKHCLLTFIVFSNTS